MKVERVLDIPKVAKFTGLTVSTIRTYRRDGRMPKEDLNIGGSPVWYESTVLHWKDNRPGRWPAKPETIST